jgi:hypothetical protein
MSLDIIRAVNDLIAERGGENRINEILDLAQQNWRNTQMVERDAGGLRRAAESAFAVVGPVSFTVRMDPPAARAGAPFTGGVSLYDEIEDEYDDYEDETYYEWADMDR